MWFVSIVFFFPTIPDPTGAEMNYTIAVFGGVIIFATIYYYFPKYGGVYWFEGPVGRIRLEQGDTEEDAKRERSGSVGSVEKKVEDVTDEKQVLRE